MARGEVEKSEKGDKIEKISKQDIDRMGQKVKNWLADEGHLKGSPSTDNDHWRLVVNMGNTTLEVFQPKEKNDCVVMVAVTNFSPEHKKALVNPANGKILQLLQLELIRGGVQVDLKMNQEGPQAFAVIDILYYDGLSKDALYQRLQRLVNVRVAGVIMINMMIGAEFKAEKIEGVATNLMYG